VKRFSLYVLLFAAILIFIYFAPMDIMSVAIFLDRLQLIMLAVVAFFWLWFVLKIWRLRPYNRLLHILNEENDPARFLAELDKFLANNPRAENWVVKETATNRAVAYLNLGEFDQSVLIWQKLLAEIKGIKSEIIWEYNTVYSLVSANLERGDIPQARAYYEHLQILATQRATPRYFAKNLEFIKARFAFENGEIVPLQNICEKMLQERHSAREYVELCFRLAAICEKAEDLAERRRYLEEVVSKGNGLYFAQIARRKLGLECQP